MERSAVGCFPCLEQSIEVRPRRCPVLKAPFRKRRHLVAGYGLNAPFNDIAFEIVEPVVAPAGELNKSVVELKRTFLSGSSKSITRSTS